MPGFGCRSRPVLSLAPSAEMRNIGPSECWTRGASSILATDAHDYATAPSEFEQRARPRCSAGRGCRSRASGYDAAEGSTCECSAVLVCRFRRRRARLWMLSMRSMIATRLKPVLIASALLVLAGSLGGCGGTSSDKGFQSLAPQEMKVAADAGAGAAPANSSSPSAIAAPDAAPARSRRARRQGQRIERRTGAPRQGRRQVRRARQRPATPPTRSARRTCSKSPSSRCRTVAQRAGG